MWDDPMVSDAPEKALSFFLPSQYPASKPCPVAEPTRAHSRAFLRLLDNETRDCLERRELALKLRSAGCSFFSNPSDCIPELLFILK